MSFAIRKYIRSGLVSLSGIFATWHYYLASFLPENQVVVNFLDKAQMRINSDFKNLHMS